MKKDIPPAWGTAYDRFSDPSESFTASRDGLVYLRGKIDEALEKGQATIGSEAGFDFQTIVVADVHPAYSDESGHPFRFVSDTDPTISDSGRSEATLGRKQ